jgi:hypothetical protein
MRIAVYTLIIITIVVTACTRKGLPIITERKKVPSPPAIKASDIQPDLAKGKLIFTNRCGRCHDLPKPEQYTAQRWEGILSYMNPRAGLDIEQGVHVTAYLKANAAK